MRPSPAADGVPRNRLLAHVSAVEQSRLAPFLTDVDLPSGDVLLAPNSEAKHVWFMQDAVTSTVVTTPEGNSVEVGLIGLEGMTGLGLLLGEPRSAVLMIVQIPGRASRMESGDFVREVVERNGETRRLLLRFANGYFGVVAQAAACNASHSVEQRLARWLAMARDRVGRDEFPLTHEFMAMMIGVRRASVTGVAGSLRADGAIEYAKGHVRILDRSRLENRACECYPIIRERIEAVFR